MKKIITVFILIFSLIYCCEAQKLTKDEVIKYNAEVESLLQYLEETLNFIGDAANTAQEKEIIYSESWNKIFIDDKVQIEDDLDANRKTPINKDVQAYLKDIDFFFTQASFKFDIQNITNGTRDDGSVFFKATLSRHLTATTINSETVDNVKNRFVEINLDRKNSSMKIASIYTSKVNEKEELRNWWNTLSTKWKARLGQGVKLYDSIPMESVGMISNVDFMASYPAVDPITGDTVLKDKIFKNDMAELDSKLKQVTQKQYVNISGLREIISVEPLSELSDLLVLDISGTSVEDITTLRNANKLKVLRANSTLIEDISVLKYVITLEELEIANTNIDNIAVVTNLKNLQKLNISNTMVNRLTDLKNCPTITSLIANGCKISNISALQDMPQITILDISNTTVRDLSPLQSLASLQSLNISGTPVSNLQSLSELQNINELYCSNTNIKDLTPLSGHRKLSKIYCDNTKIGNTEAGNFSSSNPFTLVIYDTEALVNWWNTLPIYWKAVFSQQIKLDSEPTTEQLHEIINMQELNLSGNPYMQNLMPVSRLTNLKSLNIANTEIPSLIAIQALSKLEILNLKETYITDLSPLQEMTNLKVLNIMNTPITDLTPLVNDPSIELILADSTNIKRTDVVALKEKQRDVTVVYQTPQLQSWWSGIDQNWKDVFRNHVAYQGDMPNGIQLQKIIDLREISISGDVQMIQDLEPLVSCNWLEKLSIPNQSVHDIKPLADKEYLVEINLQNNPISSLSPIENDLLLETINIGNTQISDLDPLSKMTNLKTLDASGTPLKSLKPLSGLPQLENLFINNTNVKSLSPIEDIVTLKQLKVYNTKVKSKTITKLQEKRLDLNIVYY